MRGVELKRSPGFAKIHGLENGDRPDEVLQPRAELQADISQLKSAPQGDGQGMVLVCSPVDAGQVVRVVQVGKRRDVFRDSWFLSTGLN